MDCPVPIEVRLTTEHADVGSLERAIAAALADVGRALRKALVARLEHSCRRRARAVRVAAP